MSGALIHYVDYENPSNYLSLTIKLDVDSQFINNWEIWKSKLCDGTIQDAIRLQKIHIDHCRWVFFLNGTVEFCSRPVWVVSIGNFEVIIFWKNFFFNQPIWQLAAVGKFENPKITTFSKNYISQCSAPIYFDQSQVL